MLVLLLLFIMIVLKRHLYFVMNLETEFSGSRLAGSHVQNTGQCYNLSVVCRGFFDGSP